MSDWHRLQTLTARTSWNMESSTSLRRTLTTPAMWSDRTHRYTWGPPFLPISPAVLNQQSSGMVCWQELLQQVWGGYCQTFAGESQLFWLFLLFSQVIFILIRYMYLCVLIWHDICFVAISFQDSFFCYNTFSRFIFQTAKLRSDPGFSFK